MNLYLRLIKVFLFSFFTRGSVDILSETTLHFRVWPNDLDPFMHMNNGRYLTVMDLGRVHFMLRTGMFFDITRRGWRPLLGSAEIQYIRQLDPFTKYELITKIKCWDRKWVYLEQRFVADGKTAAIGLVRGLFRGKNGNIPTSTIMEMTGIKIESPECPQQAELWRLTDEHRKLL